MKEKATSSESKIKRLRAADPSSDPVLLFLALFFPISETGKQILLTVSAGEYDWWHFPFQLCSLPLYLLPIYLILSRKRFSSSEDPSLAECEGSFEDVPALLGAFLLDFSLLGGVFAFFDQSGMHYELPVLTLHSYLWHICMILLSVRIIAKAYVDPKDISYRKVAALFLFFAGLATVFNVAFHSLGIINLFYISPYYPMHQVFFRRITDLFGNPVGITAYLCSVLLGGFLIHKAAAAFARR